MLPALDLEGRILLEDQCRISWAANGNGGLYEALHTSNALHDMAQYDDQVVGDIHHHAHDCFFFTPPCPSFEVCVCVCVCVCVYVCVCVCVVFVFCRGKEEGLLSYV
jgi:hypothetical protein